MTRTFTYGTVMLALFGLSVYAAPVAASDICKDGLDLPSQALVGAVVIDSRKKVTGTVKDVVYDVKAHKVDFVENSLVFDNTSSPIHAFDFGFRDVSGNPALRLRLVVQAEVDGKAQTCQLVQPAGAHVWVVAIGEKEKTELPAGDAAYARILLYFLDERR